VAQRGLRGEGISADREIDPFVDYRFPSVLFYSGVLLSIGSFLSFFLYLDFIGTTGLPGSAPAILLALLVIGIVLVYSAKRARTSWEKSLS
jgi:VIT1/CCC1 family predicted Fe2+/Mn2+ transporter